MIRPAALTLILLSLIATGCFADTNVTDSGKGLPVVTVDLPLSVSAGDRVTATFRIQNPGPGDIAGLSIAFVRVGNDFPIVDYAAKGSNPAIAAIDPEPLAVDRAGVVYRFPGIEEGGEVTISFELVIPDHLGPVANSVTVSAAEDAERLDGIRLETTVE